MANDNTFAGANQVRFVDGEYTAQDRTGGRDDVDLFVFRLEAGQTVTAVTDNGDDGDPDTFLALFDSSGNVLAQDDDAGENFESLLTYTADSGGTYYIGVSSFANFPTGNIAPRGPFAPEYSGDGGSNGPYTLDLLIA
ncbi:MAG: PPC domain-containing protein [Acetobacteraceae bacterium]|nr:PPC domain-containing protein [Acetobacteraceae bacterium]